MDPAYAAAYRDLYDRHWWWRARERFLLDRLAAEADASPRPDDRRILDVGCGDALFFEELSRFGTVRGVEPDADLLSEGPWRAEIHAGTLETFRAEARFDWILMLDVLEHIAEPSETLRRARQLATETGVLYLTVPAFQSLWTRHDELNHHYRRYDRSSLGTVLAESGWKPDEMTYFFHSLAPLKLLIKWKERILRGEPRVESVPPDPINDAAYFVSRVEQRILAPLNLPFGTSLYARCRPMDAGTTQTR